MNRRDFLLITAAATTAPILAQAEILDYTPGLVDEQLAAGKTVYVDFKTDWCSTCRAMANRVNAFREANPAYDENIVFIDVDFDRYGNSALAARLKVHSRSTHLVLKGDEVLGRVSSNASKKAIGGLMDLALEAATQA